MMREITTILDILCTFLENFWLYSLINIFFSKRYINEKISIRKKLADIISIGVSGCVVIGMNFIVLTSPYTIFVWMITTIICTCFFWKCDLLSASAIIGMYAFILSIYSNVVITIVNILGGEELIYSITVNKGIFRFVFLIIYQFIWALINIFLIVKFKEKFYVQNRNKQFIQIAVIGLIGSTFFAVQMLKSFEIKINLMWYVFLVFIVLLIYGMYYKNKKETYQKELEMIIKHNDLLEKNYERISKFYSENAKLYHDMKHHFNLLYNLIDSGNQDSAKEYLEKIIEPIEQSKVPIRSGVEMLDVVLYEMEKKAKANNINIEFFVQALPIELNVEKKDLSLLLVNLLNNAIDAAKEKVFVEINQVHKMIILKVTNDFKNKPESDGIRFISTKKDKSKHGWGLKIIEQIVSKYNGDIEYKVDEEYVIVDILLNDF